MAREHSRHQRRVIRDYYRNRDAIDVQRLQELVTEIHLATTPAKRDRLWSRVAAILERVPPDEAAQAGRIVAERDLEALARIATRRFGGP